ncbi:MAG: methionine--tRNA ligase [Holosporales bacterium]|jgi:methionyl-tRNA synthetase|nr:methionine--tRNA ligase [Holosporales bacterium]
MPSRYLITSALPYINGVKHLGNLIGSVLPADTYARFLRQNGCDVLHVCGTDEHGTPAEIAAQEEGLAIDVYCQQMHERQKLIYENFGIEFDFFGRTSSPSNHAFTTEVFKKLYENGYIQELYIDQYYSFDDQRFLPDRYIEGTCPYCKYDRARGDQCDGCGVLLNPEELIDPYSAISKSRNIALKKTRHFFLDMPKLEAEMTLWVEKQALWSDTVRGIAKKWLKDGVRPRCITRDLKWGITVPLNWIFAQKGQPIETVELDEVYNWAGEDKVFYVWFDAPNGYVSITQDWALSINSPDEWKKWWQPEKEQDVFYVEFMAKDNIAFHTIFWPAMMIGSGMNIKKVDDIKGFHWLTYDHGKFSTSQKRGVFTDVALELYPADYWRYYLLANCPESSDSDFSFEAFAAVVNKDLADILGNFVTRTIALHKKYCDLTIGIELTADNIDVQLSDRVNSATNCIAQLLSERKFRAASAELRALWALGNEYIAQKEPWQVLKTSQEQGEVILTHCLHLLRVFAIAGFPFIPYTSCKIFEILNDDSKKLRATSIANCLSFTCFNKGHKINDAYCLFEKIDDDTVQKLTQRFSGEGA